ncbi:MAG: DUF4349 domain-containing protein [Lawsonibacter sp.]|nr:DUF4349 domain-containing protein [Lawsonibacter sp.]
MKRKLFAIGLAAVLLLAGCGGGSSASNGASSGNSMPAPDAAEDEGFWEMEAPSAATDMSQGGGEDGAVYQNPRAKLIRRAELDIQTERFDESVKALNQLVASCGGYFENASVRGGGYRDANASRWGEYIVRVPAEQYNLFFNGAGELGYVTSKSESSEDVGEQYYDTEARLKTQRTKQERLLALLERAESMEDIIALESALSDVEYQIEMYSSELNRYDALINFATFNVYLNEVGQVTREVGETASLGQRMAAGFQASGRNLGEGFQNFLIWASYNIFLLVVLAAVAAVAVIVGKRELKRLKKQKEGPEESTKLQL